MLKIKKTIEKMRAIGLVIDKQAIGLIDKNFNDIVMQNLDKIKLQIINVNLNQEIVEASKKAAVNLVVLEAKLNNLAKKFVCAYKDNCYELSELNSFCNNFRERINDVAQ